MHTHCIHSICIVEHCIHTSKYVHMCSGSGSHSSHWVHGLATDLARREGPLEIPGRRWKDNVKMDQRNRMVSVWTRFVWIGIRCRSRLLGTRYWIFGFHKSGFTGQLTGVFPLSPIKNSTQCSVLVQLFSELRYNKCAACTYTPVCRPAYMKCIHSRDMTTFNKPSSEKNSWWKDRIII